MNPRAGLHLGQGRRYGYGAPGGHPSNVRWGRLNAPPAYNSPVTRAGHFYGAER
jgi:hypothetical protein